MTGLSRVTGASIRLVRTLIEVSVVAVGWLLGGVVGIGTIVYAVGIGPITQALLPAFTVELRTPAGRLSRAPRKRLHSIESRMSTRSSKVVSGLTIANRALGLPPCELGTTKAR
jgi:hypothetical protein